MNPAKPRQRIQAGRTGREALGGSSGELLLAVESATRVLSVALLDGTRVRAELGVEGPRVHSERILPAIDRVLEEAEVALRDVAAFAVSVGPGSFTGLRIGIATVQGLAHGSRLPVVGVPTLGALRLAAAGASGPVAVVLDARRGELYAAVFEGPGEDAKVLVEDSVFTPAALARCLPAETTVVVGEGATAGAEALREQLPGLRVLPGAEVAARAAWVGQLAAVAWRAGKASRAEEVLPRYVRRAEAEVKRTGQALEEV